MKHISTSSIVVLGISGLLLFGHTACASSTHSLPIAEKKSGDLVYSGSTPAAIAFAPKFPPQVSPQPTPIPPPSEGEKLSEEEVRHVTYAFNLAFGKPTPLDPRDVEWWKGVNERRAKEQEARQAKEQEARRAWVASLPPEDPRKIWSKDIPADRAKIKDFLKNFNKVRGLPPVDDASLEEAINSLPTWVNIPPQ